MKVKDFTKNQKESNNLIKGETLKENKYIKKIIDDNCYFFFIEKNSEENLLIKIYELNPLNSLYYQTIINIKDLLSINPYLNNDICINTLHNTLLSSINNNKFEIKYKDDSKIKMLLIIILNEQQVHLEFQNIKVECLEFIDIIFDSINQLKNEFLSMKEIFIYKNKELEIIDKGNKEIKKKLYDMEQENIIIKKEINEIKEIINELQYNKNINELYNGYTKRQVLNNNYNDEINYDYNNRFVNNYDYYSNYQNYNNANENVNYNSNYNNNYNTSYNNNFINNYNDYNNYSNFNNYNNFTYYSEYNNYNPIFSNNANIRNFTEYQKIKKNKGVKENIKDKKYEINDNNNSFKNYFKDNKIKKLDLGSKKLGNNILKEIIKNGLNQLQKLYLSDNNITDIQELQSSNFESLQKLYLSNNSISNITPLQNAKFNQLSILYLDNNIISDINILAKVNFYQLEILSLHNNKIKDISILEKVNFNKLRLLSLHDNNIDDISVFANVKFNQLKTLYLYKNLITDISVFQKGCFDKLQCLHLHDNKNLNIEKFKSIISSLRIKIKDFQI